MQQKEGVHDPYGDAFFSKIGEAVAEDRSILWIRDIKPGMLEYVASRVLEWSDDANIDEIRLCIASPGGDLDETLGIYSLLRSLPKPSVAHVFWACSGGVILALGCDVRVGFPATTILVHDPWMSVEGRSDFVNDYIYGFELQRKVIRDIFLKRTKITARKLNSMGRKEWWLDNKQALRYGILTDIVEDESSGEGGGGGET